MKKITLTHAYLVIIGICLVIFTFGIPVFQKPDEILHFKRAFALALGQLTCKTDANHIRGYFSYPVSLEQFPASMMADAIIMKPEGKFPLALLRSPYPIGDKKNTADLAYNCRLPFTGYIPQAIGIVLVMPMGNILISFFAARASAALFFFLTLVNALRIIPRKLKPILSFCSFLPMTLQQATAVSYDSVAISLGFILFAWFTNLVEKQELSVGSVFGYFALTLLFLFTKPGYYLFGGFVLFLLWKTRISFKQKIIVGSALVLGIVLVSWYGLTLPI